MSDYATPNLPSRSFDQTQQFYQQLGFVLTYRDDDWMILRRGRVELEFFLHLSLDPLTSWFSCCLRVDELSELYEMCKSANIPERESGYPRLHPPEDHDQWGRMGALIDLDGTLLRLIQN
ncbi:bleomycin resistance protein [Bradyrhizobium liaoningense]|uniref:bleomycin resistance protein n=1 Tax=Bradyrhizobium liaoningense TaxID=43992 RepID=UPI001BA597FA|nr:bleomycin resistance protein [Bradyrhizobium liaoningense]MBR0843301.1 bleomycin resistance protein [Bradyrhizobium liaoningense]MBR0856963.1 bleomycin resistance protein [Bradyrhizobium liaoningense]